MEDVIKNVSIEDIIPGDFQITVENAKELNQLATSIKKYGMVEPMIVRQKNDKYEIVSGNKRYQAAKMIGLATVPVLIRNIQNDFYNEKDTVENQNISSIANKFINPTPEHEDTLFNFAKLKKESRNEQDSEKNVTNSITSVNNYNGLKNTDIVSLAELNRKDYERDEIKMNDNMTNNQGVQIPNMNMPQTEPTFGGRFFPSLEDSQVNMGGINPTAPMNTNTPNNGLIDLTDTTASSPMPTNVMPSETMAPQNTSNQFVNPQQAYPSENIIPTSVQGSMMNSEPAMPSYGEVPQMMNNPMPQTIPSNIPEPIMNQTPIMEPTNDANSLENTQILPQFDMSQSIAPLEPLNEVGNVPQSDFSMPQMDQTPQFINPSNTEPSTMLENNGIAQQMMNQRPTAEPSEQIPEPTLEETPAFPQKEVEPVVNAIKNLANSLQSFGYNITTSEEELATLSRITIEVYK